MEDRISMLPDEVLHLILSYLKTKLSVQTCVLSKRWRYLWTGISTFHFEDSSFLDDSSFLKFLNHVVLHRDHFKTIRQFKISYSNMDYVYATKLVIDFFVTHGCGIEDLVLSSNTIQKEFLPQPYWNLLHTYRVMIIMLQWIALLCMILNVDYVQCCYVIRELGYKYLIDMFGAVGGAMFVTLSEQTICMSLPFPNPPSPSSACTTHPLKKPPDRSKSFKEILCGNISNPVPTPLNPFFPENPPITTTNSGNPNSLNPTQTNPTVDSQAPLLPTPEISLPMELVRKIKVPEEIRTSIYNKWKSSIIIQTPFETHDKDSLSLRLKRLWRTQQTPNLHALGLNFFVVADLLQDDRMKILTSQWFLGPSPILPIQNLKNPHLKQLLRYPREAYKEHQKSYKRAYENPNYKPFIRPKNTKEIKLKPLGLPKESSPNVEPTKNITNSEKEKNTGPGKLKEIEISSSSVLLPLSIKPSVTPSSKENKLSEANSSLPNQTHLSSKGKTSLPETTIYSSSSEQTALPASVTSTQINVLPQLKDSATQNPTTPLISSSPRPAKNTIPTANINDQDLHIVVTNLATESSSSEQAHTSRNHNTLRSNPTSLTCNPASIVKSLKNNAYLSPSPSSIDPIENANIFLSPINFSTKTHNEASNECQPPPNPDPTRTSFTCPTKSASPTTPQSPSTSPPRSHHASHPRQTPSRMAKIQGQSSTTTRSEAIISQCSIQHVPNLPEPSFGINTNLAQPSEGNPEQLLMAPLLGTNDERILCDILPAGSSTGACGSKRETPVYSASSTIPQDGPKLQLVPNPSSTSESIPQRDCSTSNSKHDLPPTDSSCLHPVRKAKSLHGYNYPPAPSKSLRLRQVLFTLRNRNTKLSVKAHPKGAANPEFRRVFRDMMPTYQPDMVLLTETRISGEHADNIITSLGFDNTFKVDAMGFAGGIWILWNPRAINVEVLSFSFQEIQCLIKLDSTYHSSLTNPPLEQEIKDVVFNLHPLKAPGLDGFHALFYQKSWDTIKEDLIKDLQEIFRTINIPEDWSSTLIALIPKSNNASKPQHFRPIGLCSTQYKILTKILANRIKPFLNNLISPNQGAFMKGRHTSDLFITAHEILHSMNLSRAKKGWIVIKLDIHKAFDTLSWSFITNILTAFNFPTNFINLILSGLTSANYTILVNGKMSEPFKPAKGIRQGDPISPYIFILAMEFLNHLILHQVSNRNWLPFKFRQSTLNFSHLFFADDILLFSKASSKSCHIIKETLDLFSNISGLHINLEKSKFWVSSNTPDSKARHIQNILDKIIWKHSKDGNFSIKSAYGASIEDLNNDMHNMKWIWKPFCNPKQSFFLWRSFHNALPTSKKLNAIIPSIPSSCKLCQQNQEYLSHILRDCPMVSILWNQLPLPQNFFNLPINDWLKINCQTNTCLYKNIPWNTLFCYICFFIWHNRNLLYFKSKPFQPQDILKIALSSASEFHFLANQKSYNTHCSNQIVRWKEPRQSFFKLNIDGSEANRQIGAGGIIRNDQGSHEVSFCQYVGMGDSMKAELWALQLGLTLATDMNLKKIEIETDALSLVHLINNTNLSSLHPSFCVINNCRHLLSTFESWNISHTYREANGCADLLANHARQSRCNYSAFTSPPVFLQSQLRWDKLHAGLLRRISYKPP
ncbi:reverse transcriptase [Senna tora]|uniref:Reverse transcriptase n=1 Tax=Senna tora TaxID=362788 RepID=A0A834XDT2_9FABA|nr:reverse transcriptase [Senna tora]